MHPGIVLRRLRRQPAYSLPVFLGLAIALSAALALIHVVREALVPLPYRQAEQLHLLQLARADSTGMRVSLSDWRDVQSLTPLVEDAAAVAVRRFTVHFGAMPAEEVPGLAVSRNYPEVLGISPTWSELDGPAVALSHRAALHWYGSAHRAVRETLRVDGVSYAIAAVLPEAHVDPVGAPWVYQIEPAWFTKDRRQDLDVTVVVRSSASLHALNAGLAGLSSRLAQDYPDAHTGATLHAIAVADHVLGEARANLLVLMAGAGLLLALVFANAVALGRARLQRTQGSLATRHALGESNRQRFADFLYESLALSLSAGVVAGGLVLWILAHYATDLSSLLPRSISARPDTTTFALFALLTVGLSLAASAFNVWSAAGTLIARSGRGHGERLVGPGRGQGVLVVAQCALALILLGVGSALLQSALNLSRVDPGFAADHTLQARLLLLPESLPDANSQLDFADRLLDAAAAIPGMRSVAVANQLPLDGGSTGAFVGLEGNEAPTPATAPLAQVRAVSPGFFETLGVTVTAGRGFATGDDGTTSAVALIDEGLARRLFGNAEPLNRSIVFEGQPRRVVGTVAAPRDAGLDRTPRETVYLPLKQDPAPWRRRSLTLIAATSESQATAAQALALALRPFAQDAAIGPVQPVQELVAAQLTPPAWRARAFGLFATTALLLASFGVASVGALLVSYRRRELAVCRALGASARDIAQRASGWLLRRIAIGACIGVMGIVLADHSLRPFLFETSSLALQPIGTAVAAMLIGCLAGIAWPLLSALRIEPAAALRTE